MNYLFLLTVLLGTADIEVTKELRCAARDVFAVEERSGMTHTLVFDFNNKGDDRTIRIRFESNGSTSAVFNVAGHAATRGFMYVTTLGTGSWSEELFIYDHSSGRLLKRVRVSLLDTYSSSGTTDSACVLRISEGTAPRVSSDLCCPANAHIATIEPDLLPDRWIGLTGADLVVIPYETWVSPRMKKDPFLDWVAMGGAGAIVDVPEDVRDDLCREVDEKIPFVEEQPILLHAGLGKIHFMSSKELLLYGEFDGRPGRNNNGTPLLKNPSLLTPGLGDRGKPPFIPVLIFLLVFCVLVGPVGWWYIVTRKGQPMLYLIYAPTLSLCMIIVVVVLDFLKEGFTPIVSCTACELIDQTVQKRIVLSRFDVYCPIKLGQTLNGDFSEQPYFHSQSSSSFRSTGMQGIATAPHAEGVFYGGGALPAREKIGYGFEKIVHERRRLDIWREGDAIMAENHLGVPLQNLVVCFEKAYALYPRLADGEKLRGEILEKERALETCRTMLAEKSFLRLSGAPLAKRWDEAFQAGANAYVAFRKEDLGDLTWIDSTRFTRSAALLWGIY